MTQLNDQDEGAAGGKTMRTSLAGSEAAEVIADKLRMSKSKAVSGLLTTLQQAAPSVLSALAGHAPTDMSAEYRAKLDEFFDLLLGTVPTTPADDGDAALISNFYKLNLKQQESAIQALSPATFGRLEAMVQADRARRNKEATAPGKVKAKKKPDEGETPGEKKQVG